MREEIQQDNDWVIRLRTLPESPETYYLMELMASHDFQTALQNYLDLEDLRRKLASWDVGFDAFDDMIRLRRENYEPLLPGVDAQFRELDSRMRLRIEQHKLLEQRLRGIAHRAAAGFSGDGGRAARERALSSLDSALGGAEGQQADALRERIRRLQGVITFQLRTQYDERWRSSTATSRSSRRPSTCSTRNTSRSSGRGRRPCTATWDTTRRSPPPHARVGLAREGKPADGAAGPHHRDRRDQRAQGAPRAARAIPRSGALRGRR